MIDLERAHRVAVLMRYNGYQRAGDTIDELIEEIKRLKRVVGEMVTRQEATKLQNKYKGD